MSPLSCFLVLSATLINLKQACAECTTPDNFMPYGLSVGDTEMAFARINSEEIHVEEFIYHVPFNAFGLSAPDTKLKIDRHRSMILLPEPVPSSRLGIQLLPRVAFDYDGEVYFRHSTNESDLNIVNSMACGPFDGVFIATYACVGAVDLDEPPQNYQLLVAYGPQKTIAIFTFELPFEATFLMVVLDFATLYYYPLNEDDIADDGITIIDLTTAPTQEYETVLPVETGGPCGDEGCHSGFFGDQCQHDSTCWGVRPASRTACGYPGMTKQQCLADGCCWDSRFRKTNFCFQHAVNVSEVMEENDIGCANSLAQNRIIDCGFSRITEQMCRAFNCCWRTDPGKIWCYFPTDSA